MSEAQALHGPWDPCTGQWLGPHRRPLPTRGGQRGLGELQSGLTRNLLSCEILAFIPSQTLVCKLPPSPGSWSQGWTRTQLH